MIKLAMRSAAGLAGAGCLAMASAAAAATGGPIEIKDTGGIFPESVTSNARGDLFVGSSGKGTIYRARRGERRATAWISPDASGMAAVLGVLAVDRTNTLYACSIAGAAPPEKAAALSQLRAFDLKTGAAKAAYPMPGGGAALCNDIAGAGDGTAYVSETRGGQVLRLKPGATALEVWVKDPSLAGVDGIAMGADGAVVVNTVSTGRMFRIPVGADGAAGAIVELKPSAKLEGPDGLRSLGGDRFLQAEGRGGRVSEVVLVGDKALVLPLKTGVPGVTAMTMAGGQVWYIIAKFNYRSDPALKGKDPNPFLAEPAGPLPH